MALSRGRRCHRSARLQQYDVCRDSEKILSRWSISKIVGKMPINTTLQKDFVTSSSNFGQITMRVVSSFQSHKQLRKTCLKTYHSDIPPTEDDFHTLYKQATDLYGRISCDLRFWRAITSLHLRYHHIWNLRRVTLNIKGGQLRRGVKQVIRAS